MKILHWPRAMGKTTQDRDMTKKRATIDEQKHLSKVAGLGCIICGGPATIHHCGTYMGGGRDHMRVLPLCWHHHQGPDGIDGKRISKRKWEKIHGTEEQLLEKVTNLLGESK